MRGRLSGGNIRPLVVEPVCGSILLKLSKQFYSGIYYYFCLVKLIWLSRYTFFQKYIFNNELEQLFTLMMVLDMIVLHTFLKTFSSKASRFSWVQSRRNSKGTQYTVHNSVQYCKQAVLKVGSRWVHSKLQYC